MNTDRRQGRFITCLSAIRSTDDNLRRRARAEADIFAERETMEAEFNTRRRRFDKRDGVAPSVKSESEIAQTEVTEVEPHHVTTGRMWSRRARACARATAAVWCVWWSRARASRRASDRARCVSLPAWWRRRRRRSAWGCFVWTAGLPPRWSRARNDGGARACFFCATHHHPSGSPPPRVWLAGRRPRRVGTRRPRPRPRSRPRSRPPCARARRRRTTRR